MSAARPVIAVLGGTGKEGAGLALRWAVAGYAVIIGSRDAKRAGDAAAAIARQAAAYADPVPDELDRAEIARRMARGAADGAELRGMSNAEAARACDIAVLTVPYAVHKATLEALRDALQGRILIDVTVPLVPPGVATVQLPPGGSAVAAAQDLLGDGVRVVSAFQNVSAEHLARLDEAVDCDVLVCGDDRSAREAAIALAEAAGMRGWHAGRLANSAAAEALTSVLLSINSAHGIAGAGIRITGAPRKGRG